MSVDAFAVHRRRLTCGAQCMDPSKRYASAPDAVRILPRRRTFQCQACRSCDVDAGVVAMCRLEIFFLFDASTKRSAPDSDGVQQAGWLTR